MENGIKSSSLSCGAGAVAHDRGLKPTRTRPEYSAASFRNGSEGALSASAIPEGDGVFPYVILSLPEKMLMSKPTHLWHQDPKDEWEDATMSKPTYKWH